MINLKNLRNSLTPDRIIEILKSIGGTEYRDTNDALIFKTICHNVVEDDGSFKLYYYKKNKMFHCFTHCGENFDIFELIEKRYQLLKKDYDFFKDIVLLVIGDSDYKEDFQHNSTYQSSYNKYKTNKTQVNLNHIDPNILKVFSNYYAPEWLEDGISKQTMDIFNIKYSIPLNKIIIPHYDKDNYLIGIRGRALNEEDLIIGKYIPIQLGDIIYSHPLGYNLYGLNMNKDNIRKKKMAFIFEAEKSSLQYETMFGRENNIAVAACGSNISKYQFDLLNKAGAERIIICFDNEGKNWKEKEKYREKLISLCKKNSKNCLMGYLWDFHRRLGLQDSPTDRGKEVFEQLYKEGVVWIK